MIRIPRLTVYHLVVFPLAFITLITALGFLLFTTEIEVKELSNRLSLLSIKAETADASDLLLRLKEESKGVNSNDNVKFFPEEEFQLLTAYREREPGIIAQYHGTIAYGLFARIISILQSAAGIESINSAIHHEKIDLLTLAYNLERRRYFSEALITFRQALSHDTSAQARDFVLLHSGYCLFFLNDTADAAKAWEQVMSSEIMLNRERARLLLAWLNTSEAKKRSVALIKNVRVRAEKYFEALAFADSLAALTQVAENKRDQGYYFLRGRINEAPGNYREAIENYTKVISMNNRSTYAIGANRRIYLIGAHYRPDQRLVASAKELGKRQSDTAFFEKAEKYETAEPAQKVSEKAGYLPEDAYQKLIKLTAQEITASVSPPQAKPASPLIRVRIRTSTGSLFTGEEISKTSRHIVLRTADGRLTIPHADIISREILSAKK